jgi:FAD:protein FMN transferase
MRRQLPFLISFIISIVISISCAKGSGYYETNDIIMGTVVSQKVYGANAKEAADAARKRLKELDALLSFQSASSDLSKLNTHAGTGSITLAPETIFLLKKSLYYSKITHGSFNILVGPLVKRWNVTAADADVPSQKEIDALLPLIKYTDLTVDEAHSSARLEKKGQMADLGGIAKGYASDEVIRIYKKYGITSAIIDIGGNIGLLGASPDGTPWRIGIQNPGAERGTYLGYVKLMNKSLSTSGAYERFFKKNGKIYHHIIDPATGYPSDSGLLSASIIANESVDSDALSKIFVMGAARGISVVKTIHDTDAVLVTKDKKIIITKGIVNLFHLTDKCGYSVIIK